MQATYNSHEGVLDFMIQFGYKNKKQKLSQIHIESRQVRTNQNDAKEGEKSHGSIYSYPKMPCPFSMIQIQSKLLGCQPVMVSLTLVAEVL